MLEDTSMLKPQEKLRKAVGGIIAILFIVSSIIIAYILIDFGLRAQQEQNEMQRKTYETQVKAMDIAKAINGVWSYNSLDNVLTINISNNYVEPVMITGIVILYEDGNYEVLKGNLQHLLGSRLLSGALTLPYTLTPGETLTIKIDTQGEEPISVKFSVGTSETISSLSAEQEEFQKIYRIVLAPVAFKEGTITTKGCALETYTYRPSDIIVHRGIEDPDNDITYVYEANDGLIYNVTSELWQTRWVTEVEVIFSNINSNAVKLNFSVRIAFNKEVSVEFYLWNWHNKSWDFIYSASVGTDFTDISFSTTATDNYLYSGSVRLSINATRPGIFTEYLDYVGLAAYVLTENIIYIGVGGSNKIYKYEAGTDKFEGPITAEYNGVPIIFESSTSMVYDGYRNLLWIVNGTSLYYYNVTDDQWYIYSSSLPESVSNGCSLIYINNKLFVFIGGNSNRYYIFDLSAWGSQPSGPYNLSFTISDYGVAETDGSYIYILAGGGSIGFYKLNPVTLEVTKLNDSPTGYAVGLAYDGDRNRLWLIGKGGGIHYYIINSGVWKPFQYQIPYTPQNQGNRLEYANNKLYHIRDDSTRELWIIYVGG